MAEKFTHQRQKEILNLLLKNSQLQVYELAEMLNVTQATIRRDLTALESLGKLYRTHGGAILKEQTVSWLATTLEERMKSNVEKKESIAQAVVDYIDDSESIMMDGSSTNMFIASKLAKLKNNLLIITNSQPLGTLFVHNEDSDNSIYTIGGELLFGTQNTVGPIAENNLNLFRADKAIISTTSIIPEEGLFSASPQESEIKKLMIKYSKETILVFDSTKVGIPALSKFNEFENIDVIITNSDIDDKSLKLLKSKVKIVKLA
jgi:DeoR family transcriptional regulator of aga operon/DeoR family fructose operon transcriptional repressor